MMTPWRFVSGKPGVRWMIAPILLFVCLIATFPAHAGSGPPAYQEMVTLVVDAPPVTASIDAPCDSNWFSFTISVPGSYQFHTIAGSLTDDILELYGPDSTSRLITREFGNGYTFNPLNTFSEALAPGTYYLRIMAGYAWSYGSYSIRIISLPFTPRVLTIDGAAVTNDPDALSGEEWYSFIVSTAGMYCIQTRASSVRWDTVTLYGPDSLAMQLGEDYRSGNGPLGGLTRQLNPGTYYVRVLRPWTGTETGIYLIRVATAAPPVALPVNGSPVAANIAASWEIDWFTFTLTSTQTVTITTSPGQLKHDYLTLYGPDTRERVMAQDELSSPSNMGQITQMLAPGTYYARVEGFYAGSTGSYTIQAAATPVAVTTLGIDAPPTSATMASETEPSWFRFTVADPGLYTIDTRADTLTSTGITLYNANDLSTQLDEIPSGGIGEMASRTQQLAPGTYYIQVSGLGNMGQYWIRVTQADPIPIMINSPAVTGNLMAPCDLNWYVFTVTEIQAVTILTSAGTLTDNYLLLYGNDAVGVFAPLAADDDNGPGLMARLTRRLLPGIYYLRLQARDANGTGTYSLRVASGDALIPTLAVGGAMQAGVLVSDIDEHWYKFTIKTAGVFTIDTRLINLDDDALALFGPNDMTLPAGNSDRGGVDSAASLTRRLLPGTYYVRVTGSWLSHGGNYNICLVDSTPITNLTVGGSVITGNIVRTGDINWYRFTLTVDTNVVITSTAGTLTNNHMFLSRADDRYGSYVEDDNSGPGYMAEIKGRLGPGTYYVRVVGHFGGNTGTYGIQVKGK